MEAGEFSGRLIQRVRRPDGHQVPVIVVEKSTGRFATLVPVTGTVLGLRAGDQVEICGRGADRGGRVVSVDSQRALVELEVSRNRRRTVRRPIHRAVHWTSGQQAGQAISEDMSAEGLRIVGPGPAPHVGADIRVELALSGTDVLVLTGQVIGADPIGASHRIRVRFDPDMVPLADGLLGAYPDASP